MRIDPSVVSWKNPSPSPMPDDRADRQQIERLALYRQTVERIQQQWAGFSERRRDRLLPHPLLGEAAEKITESILEDLFTNVLDWPLPNVNPQIERADIVLTDRAIKKIIIEAKRPGSLAWSRRAFEQALEQAARYGAEQKVKCIAISDGVMLYAADLCEGGKRDRVFVSLDADEPSLDLWWISLCGIYRPVEGPVAIPRFPQEGTIDGSGSEPCDPITALVHPKYKLPANCFAFVADYSDPHTWKLPYLMNDGSVDAKRLPKAIQAVLTNYRGARVGGIPEGAVPEVLKRLGVAATRAGHMPPLAINPARIYRQLAEALDQLGISLKAR